MPQRTGSGFRGVLDTPRSLPVEGGEECTNAKDRPLSNHGTFNRKRSSPLPAARPPPLETSPTSPNSSTSETPTRSIPNEQNGRRDSDMYRYHYDEPTLEFSKVCQDPQKPYKSVLERYEISPSSGAAAPEYPQEGGGLNFAHARINTTNGSIGCNNTSIKTCINIKNYHQASAELDQGRILFSRT
ncbi:hypothetical protein BDV98DRAFT_248622 [Pterulicium gracile]|uniref:Uncharacterized protein n=1 Tax=Pterulicium gracile TaxID=1884261 RepID=A0A5C3Q8R2_9AGAR|nr:hypothetical protein BDV98DRAFT_248622 [Pterula gracilis]